MPPPTYYAVLIGNQKFPSEPGLPTLRCPLNDVRSMAELLRAEQHGPYDVSVLEDEPHHVAHRAIYSALKKAGRDDRVLLYYAGHGKLSEDDGSLYLASSNTQLDYLPATSVATADIMRFMNSSASKQLILILDCCYSGAVDKLLSGTVFRGEVADQISSNFRGAGGNGSYILTASTSLQRAEEREGDQNGLLTKHLIAGIRDGRADRDDDGFVSMHELTQYVQDQVRSEGRQTPLCYTLREEDGGLIIAKTGKAARSRKLAEVQDEIFSAAAAHRASIRTVRSALILLLPDPAASVEDRSLASHFVDRLHLSIRDSRQFIDVLEDAPALASSLTLASSAIQRALEGERDDARMEAAAAAGLSKHFEEKYAVAVDDLSRSQSDLHSLESSLEYLNQQMGALKESLATETAQREQLEAALARERDDPRLRQASEEVSRLSSKYETVEADLFARGKELSQERQRATAAETKLKTLQGTLAEQARLRKASDDAVLAQREAFGEAGRSIDELSAKASQLTGELASERQRTEAQQAELKSLHTLIAESNAAIEKLNAALRQERTAKDALESDIKTISKQLASEKKARQTAEAAVKPAKAPRPALTPKPKPVPLTEAQAAAQRDEAVLILLRQHAAAADLYISPKIPADKLANATSKTNFSNRKVLGLLNCTIFGSAKDAVLFGPDALFWHNLSTSHGTLKYVDIDSQNLRLDGRALYANGQKIDFNGAAISPDSFLKLVRELAALSHL